MHIGVFHARERGKEKKGRKREEGEEKRRRKEREEERGKEEWRQVYEI
jgi:hypothetical protein